MGLSFLRLQQQDRLSKHLYLRQSNCGAFGDPSLWVRWLGCPDRATFHCGTCMGLPLHRLGRRQAIHYCWSWDSAGAPWRESLPRWVWSSLPSCACGHRGRCDSDTWLRSGVWKFETHWMSTWVHYAALLILLMYRACFSTLIPDPSWLKLTPENGSTSNHCNHALRDCLAFLVFCTNWDAVGWKVLWCSLAPSSSQESSMWSIQLWPRADLACLSWCIGSWPNAILQVFHAPFLSAFGTQRPKGTCSNPLELKRFRNGTDALHRNNMK